LTPERIAELDGLGMVWEPVDALWDQGIAAAREYFSENGHLDVPRSFVAENGFKLGQWLGWRRMDWRNSRLPSERYAALTAIRMIWDPHEYDWQRGVAAAQVFRKATGHLEVPSGYVTARGFRLGRWLERQRGWARTGKLDRGRIAELDGLGIVWNPRDAEWAHNIEVARAYREAKGHLRPKATYATPDGFTSVLPVPQAMTSCPRSERIAELDGLGMVGERA